MPQYIIPKPIYPTQQPQSAGLCRKPPGFEFMMPKTIPQPQPIYTEMPQQPYMYPQPYPPYMYYGKISAASPMIPPTKMPEYDMSAYKKQPLSSAAFTSTKVNNLDMIYNPKPNLPPTSASSVGESHDPELNEIIQQYYAGKFDSIIISLTYSTVFY